MTAETALHLAYFEDPPSIDQFDVKQVETGQMLGHPAIFTVIGDSHYIRIPEIDYYEILSCKPLDQYVEIPLTLGYGEKITHQTSSVIIETHIEAQPLSEFPDPNTFDIAYQFGPDAYTTINCLDSETYETYHTYPEFGIALYSKTELTQHPGTVQLHSTDLQTRANITPDLQTND